MTARCAMLFLALALAASTTNATAVLSKLYGTCNTGTPSTNPANVSYFRSSLYDCADCPTNSRYSPPSSSCKCNDGFANFVSSTNATVTCIPCTALGLVVGFFPLSNGSERCVPCGGITPPPFGLSQSFFSAEAKRCVCSGLSAGMTIVQSVGAVRLDQQYCAPCAGAAFQDKCVVCDFPLVASGSACVCSTGYSTLGDGTCVLQSTLSQLFASSGAANYQVTPRNIDNTGASGTPVTSLLVSQYTSVAASMCSVGNQTACNMLVNLCVLAGYATSSSPCSLYLTLLARSGCRGLACEVPSQLPWLYYLRSSAAIIQDAATGVTTNLNEQLQFVVSTYTWNGTWKGNVEVVSQLHTCDVDSVVAGKFYSIGAQRQVTCFLNLRWFLVAPQTSFYELFLRDPKDLTKLIPIPVLVDYTNKDIDPQSTGDDSIRRDPAADALSPNVDGYRRRFFTYDTVGSVTVAGGPPAFVTYARRIVLFLAINPTTGGIFTPILVIQYASFAAGPLLGTMDNRLGGTQYRRTLSNIDGVDGVIKSSTAVKFTMDTSNMNNALMVTLTVMCCCCFFSAWTRAYGWMRRQQDLMLGLEAFVRFLMYLCNHLSNVFTLIVFITCWYMYIFFKYQYSLEYALPATNSYLFGMLYAALAGKGLVIGYRIIEQCNADIFVVDWERSKGQLLREDKNVPVSMWRATFVTNELVELQTFRRWNPLLCLLAIMLFLEGLRYTNLSTAVPTVSFEHDPTAVTSSFLRIALGSFFWFAITVPIYILQFQIYYKFLAAHPLREFVDLCSVSNISVVMLLEPMWGFYIHGESIHAHADISVVEFQENLQREARGDLPARGLGGQDQCQTFEIFIGGYMRHYMWVCYAELQREQQISLTGTSGPVHAGHHRKFFDFVTGGGGLPRVFTPTTMHIKAQLNTALQKAVRNAEKALLGKFGLHSLFDFPPNIMYMNGPFAGEGNAGKDLFFFDEFDHYGASLLYGLDFDMFIFYVLLFVTVDSSVYSTYIAMVVVYIADYLIVYYRDAEGRANIGAKTLIDDRFLL